MKIAVLGYGTVGKSICKYIEGDSRDIQIAYVLRRPGKAPEPFMTESFVEILNDPTVAIVVDALSGKVDSYFAIIHVSCCSLHSLHLAQLFRKSSISDSQCLICQ